MTKAIGAAAQQAEHGDRLTMERLVLFTDAVFAITVTLLALEIRLLEHASIATHAELLAALAATWQKIIAYAISFLVIAAIWRVHLRRYRYLAAVDSGVISGNVIQLLLVGLVPFATSMVNTSLDPLVVSIYAGIILASVLVGWVTWHTAARDPHLAGPELTNDVRRADDLRSAVTAGVFMLSIAVAWWHPVWALWSWILQMPGNALVMRWLRRRARSGP
ncbi:MAG: TMEM175 family protein [Pseudomonadota bacterium]|nr:TMEM175 family protein [Pseudomonadota bacterium]